MRLILTEYILRKVYKPLISVFPLLLLKRAAKKSLSGLGNLIKGIKSIPDSFLIKIYLTSKSGAGRVIFLINSNSNKTILVMIKEKKDKRIGENMTVKNSCFKSELNKNLGKIINDLEKNKFNELDLD